MNALSDLISIFCLLSSIAGAVGIVALWTQHDIDRKRELDAALEKEKNLRQTLTSVLRDSNPRVQG